MGSFNSTIITKRGHELMAKATSGLTKIEFTKVNTSDYQYAAGTDYEALTALSGVKQTSLVSNVEVVNDVAVKVRSSITNTELSTGYYLRAIGLYAMDPNLGEILYSITTAVQADWIPPNNGISASSILIDLVTVISNASDVTIDVDPNAVATVSDIINLQGQITDVKDYIGYTDSDIFGVEADFKNKVFKRLAGSINKLPGADFDAIKAFGGRKRCNVTDDGKVIAYYGDAGYSETGKLTQAITIGETTYPVDTPVQVMVEQPKFFYKVVPLTLEKITDGIGYHLRKARYYVSDTPKTGFKLHPAFMRNGIELQKIYLSAYEGSIYDVSASVHLLADEQVADFTAGTGDKLASIAYAKPASGLTQLLTRANSRKLANNRGVGWQQSDALSASVTQLLLMIEYTSFNSQTAIANGVVSKTDDAATNMSELTGATTNLGNASGAAVGTNGLAPVTYRGEENPWGNIYKWQDGLNIEAKGIHQAYWADHGFVDDIKTDPYKNCGFTLAKANGYASAFGYSEDCDFLFLPSETVGASNLPIGDYFYQNYTYNGFFIAQLGGTWSYGSIAGAFNWSLYHSSGHRNRTVGTRLLYVPQN